MQERIQEAYSTTSKVLNALYIKRKRTLLFQRLTWGITGLYLVCMLVLMGLQSVPALQNRDLTFLESFSSTPNNPYASLYPILGLMVLLYPTTLYFTKAFQRFKIEEQKIMAKMVSMLFPYVEFTQGALAPVKEVVKSNLFVSIKDNAPIYNYGQIRSRTTNTEINVADLGIVERNVASKFLQTLMHIPILNMFGVLYQNVFKNIASNRLADNTNYSFRGMFCWLNFKKTLTGHTVVLPKSHLAQFDRWASFGFKEEQQIHLEDPRFTERFIVFATDQVEARYVLSSALMEKVIALKDKFNRPIFMSFENRKMYLAVQNDNGIFSFPSGNLDNIKVVEELADEIDTALQVSNELKMKRKIQN